jgi:hypothetical protein
MLYVCVSVSALKLLNDMLHNNKGQTREFVIWKSPASALSSAGGKLIAWRKTNKPFC